LASGLDMFVRVLGLWFGYTQGGLFAGAGFLGAIQTMVMAQAVVQIGILFLIWVQTRIYDDRVKQEVVST
jgi:hypothetical protein